MLNTVRKPGGEWPVKVRFPSTTVISPFAGIENLDMFFGGVGAAYWDSHGELTAAADPRRTGGTSLAGSG